MAAKSKNTRRIEESGINTLKSALLRCPMLDAHISENDKTPSWDGQIFVYRDETQTKDCMLGAPIPVQVKSTEKHYVSNFATFKCDIADLRNYYQDGGCMFFLVSVDLKTQENTIFYSSLHVYDLKQKLEEAHRKKQNSKSIRLETFPKSNPDEMLRILHCFLGDRAKQIGFVDREIPSLEDLMARGRMIDNISFSVPRDALRFNDFAEYVMKHDIYLYAKMNGLDIDIPINRVRAMSVSKNIDAPICIAGRKYQEGFRFVYTADGIEILIGKCIHIKKSEVGKECSVLFRPEGTLSEVIDDAELIINIIQSGEVMVGNVFLQIGNSLLYELELLRQKLAYYRDMKKTLDILGVAEELDCTRLTQEDSGRLYYLAQAVLHNRGIRFSDTKGEAAIWCSAKIANLTIWLWGTRQCDGTYSIKSYFAHRPIYTFEKADTQHKHPIPIPIFMLMEKEAFTDASNIDYKAISEDLSYTEPVPMLIHNANIALLAILDGYDEQITKSPELLSLAMKINDWIGKCHEECDPRIFTLNRLQIIKRERKLYVREITELSTMTDSNFPAELRCAASLLLDDVISAQEFFDEMPPEQQKEFLTYPICHFGDLTMRES